MVLSTFHLYADFHDGSRLTSSGTKMAALGVFLILLRVLSIVADGERLEIVVFLQQDGCLYKIVKAPGEWGANNL